MYTLAYRTLNPKDEDKIASGTHQIKEVYVSVWRNGNRNSLRSCRPQGFIGSNPIIDTKIRRLAYVFQKRFVD